MSRRASSESCELDEAITAAWDHLGRRGTKAEMLALVLATVPAELRDYLAARGVNTSIGSFFRKAGTQGLPQAPEVDADGTHADCDQLTFEDFEYIVQRHLDSAEAHTARADQWVAACVARYGKSPTALVDRAIA